VIIVSKKYLFNCEVRWLWQVPSLVGRLLAVVAHEGAEGGGVVVGEAGELDAEAYLTQVVEAGWPRSGAGSRRGLKR
jgi:hypothetical protein